jgi:hypothetical protein
MKMRWKYMTGTAPTMHRLSVHGVRPLVKKTCRAL